VIITVWAFLFCFLKIRSHDRRTDNGARVWRVAAASFGRRSAPRREGLAVSGGPARDTTAEEVNSFNVVPKRHTILRCEYRTARGSLRQRAIMYKPVLGIVLAAVLAVVFSARSARSSDNDDTATTTTFSAHDSTTHVQGTRLDLLLLWRRRAFVVIKIAGPKQITTNNSPPSTRPRVFRTEYEGVYTIFYFLVFYNDY